MSQVTYPKSNWNSDLLDYLNLDSTKLYYKSYLIKCLSNKLNFFVAEKYHHNYFSKNPSSIYCNALIPPKLKKLQKTYSNILKI